MPQRLGIDAARDADAERLRVALDAARVVGVWDWDPNTDRVHADANFARLYGVAAERLADGAPLDEFLAAVHPDDLDRVRGEIGRALDQAGEYATEYRLVGADGEVRWVLARGAVTRGADGRARLPGVVIDITERKAVEQDLAAARAAAEAAAAEREALVEQLAESEAKFRLIADTMPQMVWATRADGFHDYYNARWYEFTGAPPGSTDGEGWNDMFHPEDQARAWELWERSLQSGQPYEVEYRLRHHTGVYRWTLGRALPIRDKDGRITRWFGTCTDIDELKKAAEARELLSHELSHRIKNIFAVISALVALTARRFPEARDFAQSLRTRIQALARAHEFVRPHSRASEPTVGSMTLHAFLRDLFSAYSDDGDERIRVEGEDAVFDDQAATPVALLFHELATNAAKYGALSAAAGRVRLVTGLEGDRYVLVWEETGGPPVEGAPDAVGFGFNLAQMSVEGQLGGRLERSWAREGLRLRAELPLSALSRRRQTVT